MVAIYFVQLRCYSLGTSWRRDVDLICNCMICCHSFADQKLSIVPNNDIDLASVIRTIKNDVLT